MYELDKKELQYWINRYSETEQRGEKEIEENLTKKFQTQGFANKEEIIELLHWKFGTMQGRLKRELNLIGKEPDLCIIEKTKQAFKSREDLDLEKIKVLKSIKGFGNAVTSVVLTFYNPNKYGVFDIHAWRELFGKETESKDYNTTKALLRFFEELREISKETGLTCREVEKALFTKNYLGSKGSESGKGY